MSVQDDQHSKISETTLERRKATVSRRDLLKRGVASMPAIVTLHSGAALAASSIKISASHPDTTDRLGRTLCLDTNSVYPAHPSRDIYNLGDPPQAVVNIFPSNPDRVFHVDKNRGSVIATRGAVCEGGQVYWYNDRDGTGWHPIELPYRGVVVSSGAMQSVADYVHDNLL